MDNKIELEAAMKEVKKQQEELKAVKGTGRELAVKWLLKAAIRKVNELLPKATKA